MRITTEEKLDAQSQQDLFSMTPWAAAHTQGDQIKLDPSAATTVDFIVSTHRVWLGTGGEPV